MLSRCSQTLAHIDDSAPPLQLRYATILGSGCSVLVCPSSARPSVCVRPRSTSRANTYTHTHVRAHADIHRQHSLQLISVVRKSRTRPFVRTHFASQTIHVPKHCVGSNAMRLSMRQSRLRLNTDTRIARSQTRRLQTVSETHACA